MSDRCYGWRLLLSRRSDGDISRYEWEALDDHMAGCRDCRMAAQSDRALHLALTQTDFPLAPEATRRLDDSILSALGIPERLTVPQRCGRTLRELWARWEAIPNLYLMQIGTGTLAAASLTAVYLLAALHPLEFARPADAARLAVVRQHNEPPVPLESLLDRPVPRAASLWTAPPRPRASEKSSSTLSQPAPAPQTPALPDRHSALPETAIRG